MRKIYSSIVIWIGISNSEIKRETIFSYIGAGFTFAPSNRDARERKIKEEERKMKNRGRENPLSLGALKSFINLFLFRMINTKRVKIDGMKREA